MIPVVACMAGFFQRHQRDGGAKQSPSDIGPRSRSRERAERDRLEGVFGLLTVQNTSVSFTTLLSVVCE